MVRDRVTPRWDPSRDEKLTELHAMGLYDSEIAERMGIAKATVSSHRLMLGLPIHYEKPVAPVRDREGAIPPARPDPLSWAQRYLPGFDRETLTIDGRPVKLDEVMRRTNAILKGYGMPQMTANPAWLV